MNEGHLAFTNLIKLPQRSVPPPARQVLVQHPQSILYALRQCRHHVYDRRVGGDIREETEHYWLIFTFSVLGWSLNTRAMHPADKQPCSMAENRV